jgi:hypothetical protein
MLYANKPFAFSKFNDGEIGAIMDPAAVVSRGFQQSSKEMAQKLLEALTFSHPDYHIGIPCSRCYPEHHKFARARVKGRVLSANLLINANAWVTTTALRYVLPFRRVHMVVSEQADVSRLWFKPVNVVKVPDRDAWQSYHNLLTFSQKFGDGDVVLLCCGPLGRVLVYDWFRENPNITYLELGSMLDPVTKKRAYMYHLDSFPLCPECYPARQEQPCFPDRLLQECTTKECLYFNTWENYLSQYKNDYRGLYNMYRTHMVNNSASKNDTFFYSLWMMARASRLMGHPKKDVESAYQLVEHYFPGRIEPLVEFISNCVPREKQLSMLSRLPDEPMQTGYLGHDPEMYEWRLEYAKVLAGSPPNVLLTRKIPDDIRRTLAPADPAGDAGAVP